MFHSKRAVCGTCATGKLGLSSLSCHIFLINVAIFTEVGGPHAESVGNFAAELALVFYIVCAMLYAVDNTGTNTHGRAFTTHELLWFEFVIFIKSEMTPILCHATEVK